ncbi:MAG: Crp/Fnr family transcriptional regulator [Desulfobacteraceae bacterium]|nr:Crp/Fnr family transcriptional regulator [Desulfobacteraceae bacterium]
MIEKLKTIPLFSGLETEHFSEIIHLTKRLKFEKGRLIFNEGEAGDGFYIVETGKVKIFKLSFEGKEQILHIYGPGKAFGEVPVFEGNNFPASAMAMAKSEILFIPRDKFVTLISETPGLAMNMLGMLSMRLREFTIQIENLSLKEVPARLASYVLTLSEEHGKAEKVILPISKAQLANLIGTTPETVSRVLKKMTDGALIKVDAKTITIKNYDGLIDLSDSGRLE